MSQPGGVLLWEYLLGPLHQPLPADWIIHSTDGDRLDSANPQLT